MTPAYVCVTCHGCERTFGPDEIERVDGTPFCQGCAAIERARPCPLGRCAHPNAEHSIFGCLVEFGGEDVFCGCPPPALAAGKGEEPGITWVMTGVWAGGVAARGERRS